MSCIVGLILVIEFIKEVMCEYWNYNSKKRKYNEICCIILNGYMREYVKITKSIENIDNIILGRLKFFVRVYIEYRFNIRVI